MMETETETVVVGGGERCILRHVYQFSSQDGTHHSI